MKLESKVLVDSCVEYVSEMFDYKTDGVSSFEVPDFVLPDDFGIGLIVGPSGSGKSSILSSIGKESRKDWDNEKAIVSQFGSAEDATSRLMSMGLSSVPSWVKPFSALSTGEKARANLAANLSDGCVIDEFTSTVDRVVAKCVANGVRGYVDRFGIKGVVLATCHYDVIEWLRPNWVYDTADNSVELRGSQRRPSIKLEIRLDDKKSWGIFRQHHYLTGGINNASKQFVAYWNGQPVGFSSALPMPSGTLKDAWRGHRLVVLPDFQGLGIGKALTEWTADYFLKLGKRYYAKTTHPKTGEYRNRSEKWRPTSKNGRARKDRDSGFKYESMRKVVSYSHEYIGG